MPARILCWMLCLALALSGAACGGGDDGGGAAEASPPPSSAPADPSEAATGDGGAAASEADDGADRDGDGGAGTYTVRSGDTLSSIAQEQGTTVEAIVEANDIDDPDVIDIGQELTIPSG